jgi:hypothetical protein
MWGGQNWLRTWPWYLLLCHCNAGPLGSPPTTLRTSRSNVLCLNGTVYHGGYYKSNNNNIVGVDPLLGNDCEISNIQEPLLSNATANKYVPTAINLNAATEKLLETEFSMRSVPCRWELAADSYLLKLQRLQNKVLRTIGSFQRWTPVRDLHRSFSFTYIYVYIVTFWVVRVTNNLRNTSDDWIY